MAKGIYRRGDFQWQVKIRQDGRSLSRTFETFDEARQWRDVTVGQVSGNTYVDRTLEQRTTLKDVLTRYRDEITAHKTDPKTISSETSLLGLWMKEDFADLPIISVETSHIVAWRDKRQSEGKAPSSIINPIHKLSAVYKVAVSEWGFRLTNPTTGLRLPRQRPGREAHLTAADEKALMSACEQGPAWLPHIVRLALETAMRASELRRIQWQHVHPSHIHLPQTKNGTARDVPLTDEAAAVVDCIRAALPRRLDGWMFGDPDDDFRDYTVTHTFIEAVERAMKNHKMKVRLTFHDLRHVATTRLAEVHRDALDLAKTTGHKTLAVLGRYYNPEITSRAEEIRARKRALTAGKKAKA